MDDQAPKSKRGLYLTCFWCVATVIGAVVLSALLFARLTRNNESRSKIESEISAVMRALADYKAEFGTYPTGDTNTICRALIGENPKNKMFIQSSSIARDGAFLDPWGTSYKIYYSGDWVLIRSAGANKKFEPSSPLERSDDYFGG